MNQVQTTKILQNLALQIFDSCQKNNIIEITFYGIHLSSFKMFMDHNCILTKMQSKNM